MRYDFGEEVRVARQQTMKCNRRIVLEQARGEEEEGIKKLEMPMGSRFDGDC